jgi:hypothetical protein
MGMVPSELRECFKKPIAWRDIKTGEGYCRLHEFWESQEATTYSPEEYEAVRRQEAVRLQEVRQPAQAPPPESLELPSPPAGLRRTGTWTKQEKLLAVKMLGRGLSEEEVARRLGRTVRGLKQVKRRAERLAAG